MWCTRLAENTGRKKVAKTRHLGTIAQLCRAISSQLRHVSTIGKKKLVKQQYLLHMSPQYGNFGILVRKLIAWSSQANSFEYRQVFRYFLTELRRFDEQLRGHKAHNSKWEGRAKRSRQVCIQRDPRRIICKQHQIIGIIRRPTTQLNSIQFISRSHQLKHHKTHNNRWRDLNGVYRAQSH